MKKLIYLICIILLIVSCSQNKQDQDVSGPSISTPRGLEYWTADTILKTNPKLVKIMGELYQYIGSDNFLSSNLKNDILWMDSFRGELCKYYKRNHPTDTISQYAMADSVIAEARDLWSLYTDESTMGRVIDYDVEWTRVVFEQFNEFSKLCSICKTDQQQKMLIDEFSAWIKLEKIFSKIYVDCVHLCFWGGSIVSPTCIAGNIMLWESHVELYRKEYKIETNMEDGVSDTGTFLIPARQLLIECCKQAVKEHYNEDGEHEIAYLQTINDVKRNVSKFPQYIDQWIEKRKPWEEEMHHDYLGTLHTRNTAEILIFMASQISSIW